MDCVIEVDGAVKRHGDQQSVTTSLSTSSLQRLQGSWTELGLNRVSFIAIIAVSKGTNKQQHLPTIQSRRLQPSKMDGISQLSKRYSHAKDKSGHVIKGC